MTQILIPHSYCAVSNTLVRNASGGGILLRYTSGILLLILIREGIPFSLLNSYMSIESFYIEINIRKKK